MEVNISRTALVLLHFQKDICTPEGLLAPNDPDALARYAGTIEKTAELLAIAREADLPVIHSAFGRPQDGHFANRHGRMLAWITQAGGCVEGEEGHSFVEQLGPLSGEAVVRGSGLSAFADSSFAEVLERAGKDTLIVTGITTHWAVEGTVRIASDLGYDCVVVSDCVASAKAENHNSALERLGFIARIVTSEDVIAALPKAN